jgi:light-regulated signal transduction histidine kinase (bacteriophytochrome)
MRELINDLLAYSRVGAFRGDRVSMEAVLDRVLQDLRTTVAEAGGTVSSDSLPVVWGDPGELAQLLQNLVGNAIKFRGDEPPVVRISARHQDGAWLFAVQDNGIGIDPEYSDRIFMIFQRLHGRTEYPGTGIGLAICQKIVHSHGGQIWVDSLPGRGSTFYFTLPIREEVDP